ncbi:MAG: hypothetical protein JNM31_14360 [Flavobacteriales bacterium]|nr:hypothetical protein [Flavobacteriales bacterium]
MRPAAHTLILLAVVVHQQLNAQCDTTLQLTNCQITLTAGKPVEVERFWKITTDELTYMANGSLHDIDLSRIRNIRCGIRNYRIENGYLCPLKPTPVPGASPPALRPVNSVSGVGPTSRSTQATGRQATNTIPSDSVGPESPEVTSNPVSTSIKAPVRDIRTPEQMKLYELGRQHARESYEPWGALLASVITAPIFIAPPIIAAFPPSESQVIRLYDPRHAQHEAYRHGFLYQANRRKTGWIGIGFTLGLFTWIGLITTS